MPRTNCTSRAPAVSEAAIRATSADDLWGRRPHTPGPPSKSQPNPRRGLPGQPPHGVPRTPTRGKGQASLRSVAAGDPLPRPGNQRSATDRPTEKTPHTTHEIKDVFPENDQPNTPTDPAGGPFLSQHVQLWPIELPVLRYLSG